jgi:hypothetical protein
MHVAKRIPSVEEVQLVVGPRHRGSHIYSDWVPRKRWRKREYFHLAGLLVKWNRIYGRAPSAGSWVWRFYPQGDQWRKALDQYGKDAVDRETSRFYYSLDNNFQRRSAFSLIGHETNATVRSDRNNFAIFHHIYAGSNRDVVSEQLRLSQGAARFLGQNVPLFYSIVGDDGAQNTITLTEIESLC